MHSVTVGFSPAVYCLPTKPCTVLSFAFVAFGPGMAINVYVVSVQYSGGFLPDIILLTQGFTTIGNPFKCHEDVVFLASGTTILYTHVVECPCRPVEKYKCISL